jgi:hypothetical protein
MPDYARAAQVASLFLAGIVSCGSSGGGSGGPSGNLTASTLACPASIEAAGITAQQRASVFESLTENAWADGGCANSGAMLAPTCTRLELRKDGSYKLTATSDYTERDDAGSWNFALSNQMAGIVCLDGAKASALRTDAPPNQPSAMYFEIGTGLTFGSFGFSAAEPIARAGAPGSLSTIALPAAYGELIAEGWRKTNPFDLAFTPDAITFERSGHLSASYRAGACQHGGHFSWDKGMLTPISDDNQCDLRGPRPASVASSNEEPVFLDDLLVFYSASYRRESNTATRQIFIFDPYSNSLRVRGEFDGVLSVSSPTALTVSFENLEELPRQLVKLEVTAQKVVPAADGNGYSADGAKTTLITRDYTGVTLAPHAKHDDAFSIAPTLGGDNVDLEMTIDYTDAHQPYHGSRTFLVAIQ